MKKRDEEKVKDSGTPGRINHNKNPGGNSRRRKKRDHRLRSQSFETNVEMFVKQKEAAVRSLRKKVFQRRGEDLKPQCILIAECWTNRKHPH